MSEDQLLAEVHRVLLNFNKRAERSSSDILAATFVDSVPLLEQLSTHNNQVIYGRRGTGKTHALKYLGERVAFRGESAVYLDLRSIGSNGSIYGDGSRSLAERAGTLIQDVLNAILDGLYDIAVGLIDKAPDPKQITLCLDDLSASISEVSIKGSLEQERESRGSAQAENTAGLSVSLSREPRVDANLSTTDRTEYSQSVKPQTGWIRSSQR